MRLKAATKSGTRRIKGFDLVAWMVKLGRIGRGAVN